MKHGKKDLLRLTDRTDNNVMYRHRFSIVSRHIEKFKLQRIICLIKNYNKKKL